MTAASFFPKFIPCHVSWCIFTLNMGSNFLHCSKKIWNHKKYKEKPGKGENKMVKLLGWGIGASGT